jgi:phage gpG-like protein
LKWEQINKNSVFIGYDLDQNPGVKLLNEGGEGLAFGKHPFTMPARKFIGWTERMKKAIMKKLKYESDKAFHNFK